MHYPLPRAVPNLVDGDLTLQLREIAPAKPEDRWAGACTFEMRETSTGCHAGLVQLRFADTEELLFYGGHIGFGVDERFRGRRYAARSVKLLLPVAKRAGMAELWITCDPDNVASQKSILLAGGEFAESVDIPEYSPSYPKGRRVAMRYRFDLA